MARKRDIHAAAVALGRKGGQANKGRTSEAKAAAARENGKKGGYHTHKKQREESAS